MSKRSNKNFPPCFKSRSTYVWTYQNWVFTLWGPPQPQTQRRSGSNRLFPRRSRKGALCCVFWLLENQRECFIRFLALQSRARRRLEVGLGLGLVRRLRLSPPKGLVNMIFFVSEKKWTNPGILTLDVIGSLVCFIWFWMVVFAGNSCCDIRWNRKRFCSVGFFYWTNIER